MFNFMFILSSPSWTILQESINSALNSILMNHPVEQVEESFFVDSIMVDDFWMCFNPCLSFVDNGFWNTTHNFTEFWHISNFEGFCMELFLDTLKPLVSCTSWEARWAGILSFDLDGRGGGNESDKSEFHFFCFGCFLFYYKCKSVRL